MRLLYNSLQATLSADITDSATAVTFTGPLREWGEDDIATIATDTLAMRIDNELVHVTAYTSGASSATILRAQEGTTAAAHNAGAVARHDATTADLDPATLAADAAFTDAFQANLGLVTSFDPLLAGTSTVLGTANRTNYYRVREGGSISKVGLEIVVQNGNIDVGVFSNAGVGRNAAPGAAIARSGSTACPAVGYAEISLGSTVDVEAGDWIAMSVDSATVSLRAIHNAIHFNGLLKGRSAVENVFPLPANATPVTGMYRAFLLVGVP